MMGTTAPLPLPPISLGTYLPCKHTAQYGSSPTPPSSRAARYCRYGRLMISCRVYARQSQECGPRPKIPMRPYRKAALYCITAVLSHCTPRLFGILPTTVYSVSCWLERLRDKKDFCGSVVLPLPCGLTLVVSCRNADRCTSRTTLRSWVPGKPFAAEKSGKVRFYMCTHKVHEMGFSVVPQDIRKPEKRALGPQCNP